MKKIIATLALISLLAVPAVILAEDAPNTLPQVFDSAQDLIDKINNIGDWIFTGLLVLAAIFMVVAGYFFVTGGGNPEQLGKARNMLVQALIGVVVGLAARGLVVVITNIIAD